MTYAIITEATCDLNQEMIDREQLLILPMPISINGKLSAYKSGFSKEESRQFYASMKKGVAIHTDPIPLETYYRNFEEILKEGRDVLHIGLSSAISSTYQAAILAKNQLLPKYPDREIYVVDTLGASGGEGLMALAAAKNRDAGMDIEANAKELERTKIKYAAWFITGDLKYVKKSEKISNAQTFLTQALGHKPIYKVDNRGRLVYVDHTPTREEAMVYLADRLKDTILDPFSRRVYICHADCEKDAEYLSNLVIERCPVEQLDIGTMSPIIGTHVGPDSLALFFFAEER